MHEPRRAVWVIPGCQSDVVAGALLCEKNGVVKGCRGRRVKRPHYYGNEGK